MSSSSIFITRPLSISEDFNEVDRTVSSRQRPFRPGPRRSTMDDDGLDEDALYETVRRATRDGLHEVLWDVVTVVIAVVLVALGVPLAFAGAGGSGPAAWLAGLVGLAIVAMGVYRIYDRFGRRG